MSRITLYFVTGREALKAGKKKDRNVFSKPRRTSYGAHQGMQECARRVKQIAAGQLRIENGYCPS